MINTQTDLNNKAFILFSFLLPLSILSVNASVPVVLKANTEEVCICRKYVDFWEDTSSNQTLPKILSLSRQNGPFQTSKEADLVNRHKNSTYWLRFKVINQSTKAFRIELFDFDIDEISFFYRSPNGAYIEQKAGFNHPFSYREIGHKNVSFTLPTTLVDTASYFMRFYSRKQNVLEPMVRSYDRTIHYSLTEYILLGIFYGILLYVIFYNLLYYIMLRKTHYLIYVVYVGAILVYVMSQNGTGFQYLWPGMPQINPYIPSVSLCVGIGAMLFFSIYFLELQHRSRWKAKLIVGAFVLHTLVYLVQFWMEAHLALELFSLALIQMVLVIGWLEYRSGYKPAKWYVVGYFIMDIAFVVTWLERLGVLSSGIHTVYALNAGIVFQFAFISISIGESVKDTYRIKNEIQEKLIQQYEINQKNIESANAQLEAKVKQRTQELEARNEEIETQKNEIDAINNHLEELVYQRTEQLENRNSRIREYAFSNSHLVRGPLARILGLASIVNKIPDLNNQIIPLIEENALELDTVIKEMTKILEEEK